MINYLLRKLPDSKLKKTAISKRQDVPIIMNEVLQAHKNFAPDYDNIAADFWQGNIFRTCQKLFNFCKVEMTYKAESDKDQTSRSPGAILKTANTWGVDCKHYAGFIAGVLDGLNRKGKKINWAYRFVSYSPDDPIPEHVFIIVQDGDKILFVDPVLANLDQREPKYYYKNDKFVNMALNRISGFAARTTQKRGVGVIPTYDYSGTGALYVAPGVALNYSTFTQAPNITAPAVLPINKPLPASPGLVIPAQTTGGKAGDAAPMEQTPVKKTNWLLIAAAIAGIYLISKK